MHTLSLGLKQLVTRAQTASHDAIGVKLGMVNLAGLGGQAAILVGIGSTLLATAVLVLLVLSLSPDLRWALLSDQWGVMPNPVGAGMLRLATVIYLAAASALATSGLCSMGGPIGRGGLLLVALLNLRFPLRALHSASVELLFLHQPIAVASGLLAALSLLATSAIPAIPARTSSRQLATALIGASPILCWACSAALDGSLFYPWTSYASWRSDELNWFLSSLKYVLAIYFLWSTYEWAEVVYRGSRVIARSPSRWPLRTIAVVAVATKAIWLACGYLGVLPVALGGRHPGWRASLLDGTGSWLTAFLIVASFTVLLLVGNTLGQESRHEIRAVLIVLSVPSLLATAALSFRLQGGSALLAVIPGLALMSLFALQPKLRPRQRIKRILGLAFGTQIFVLLLHRLLATSLDPQTVILEEPVAIAAYFFLAPVVASAYLWLRVMVMGRRSSITAVCLLIYLLPVVIAHSAPRLQQIPLPFNRQGLGAAGDSLTVENAAYVYPAPGPSWESAWNGPGGSFETLTIDTVVAVALLATILLCKTPDYALIAQVVVGSSLLLSSATLLPRGALGEAAFYVLIIAALAGELLEVRSGGGFSTLSSPRKLCVLAALLLCASMVLFLILTNDLQPSVDTEERLMGFTRGLSFRYWVVMIVATHFVGRAAGHRRVTRRELDGAPPPQVL